MNSAVDLLDTGENGNMTVYRDGYQLIVVDPDTARSVGEAEVEREGGAPVVLHPM